MGEHLHSNHASSPSRYTSIRLPTSARRGLRRRRRRRRRAGGRRHLVAHRLRHLVPAPAAAAPTPGRRGGEVVVGEHVRRPRGARAVGERAPAVRVVALIAVAGAVDAGQQRAHRLRDCRQSMWPLRLRSTHADTSSSSRRTVARGWPSSGRAGAAPAPTSDGYSRHSFTATGSLRSPTRVAHRDRRQRPPRAHHRRLLLGLRRRQLAGVGVQVLDDGSGCGTGEVVVLSCSGVPHWRNCGSRASSGTSTTAGACHLFCAPGVVGRRKAAHGLGHGASLHVEARQRPNPRTTAALQRGAFGREARLFAAHRQAGLQRSASGGLDVRPGRTAAVSSGRRLGIARASRPASAARASAGNAGARHRRACRARMRRRGSVRGRAAGVELCCRALDAVAVL